MVDCDFRIAELLKNANSTLGYIKIITPKDSSSGQSGRTRIVFGSNSDGTGNTLSTLTWLISFII